MTNDGRDSRSQKMAIHVAFEFLKIEFFRRSKISEESFTGGKCELMWRFQLAISIVKA